MGHREGCKNRNLERCFDQNLWGNCMWGCGGKGRRETQTMLEMQNCKHITSVIKILTNVFLCHSVRLLRFRVPKISLDDSQSHLRLQWPARAILAIARCHKKAHISKAYERPGSLWYQWPSHNHIANAWCSNDRWLVAKTGIDVCFTSEYTGQYDEPKYHTLSYCSIVARFRELRPKRAIAQAVDEVCSRPPSSTVSTKKLGGSATT